MITGELKNKIDSLWDVFAAGGLVNPLEVIEQITYMMFIHDLDDTDNLLIKKLHAGKNSAYSKYMDDASGSYIYAVRGI